MNTCTVCDGAIQPAERIDAWYRKERYEFCSDECKTVFASAPEKYAGIAW